MVLSSIIIIPQFFFNFSLLKTAAQLSSPFIRRTTIITTFPSAFGTSNCTKQRTIPAPTYPKRKNYNPKMKDVVCRYEGKGLKSARAGEPASFLVIVDQAMKANGVYVTFEGEHAVFGVIGLETTDNTTYAVNFNAPFAGKYKVEVDFLPLVGSFRKAIGGSFYITVKGKEPKATLDLTRALDRCKSDVPGEGVWLKCNSPYYNSSNCLREGMVFKPYSCQYQVWTQEELVYYATNGPPRWIMFIGNSVLRGVFFSALDLILGATGKGMTSSSSWKCWGNIDITIGNLRLTYQDFRASYLDSSTHELVCHGEKIASDSNQKYVQNATEFLHRVFVEGEEKPTTLVSYTRWGQPEQERKILDTVLESWDGNLVSLFFR